MFLQNSEGLFQDYQRMIEGKETIGDIKKKKEKVRESEEMCLKKVRDSIKLRSHQNWNIEENFK